MNSCPAPPADNSRQVREMERRIRSLEKEIAGIKEITGVCMSAPDTVVPVFSTLYSEVTGKFTITFSSTPGEVYQVQQSTDAVEWEVSAPASITGAAPATPADEAPVTTVWTSTDVWGLDDLPIYFRVRQVPRAMLCAPTKVC